MLAWLLIAMTLSGVVGGLINYLLAEKPAPTGWRLRRWWHYVVLGLGASFTVPLFLNTISSPLVADVVGAEITAQSVSKLLVVTGFCILAAVSSRAFMSSLASKVLRLAEKANEKADDALTQSAEVQEQIADVATDAKTAKLTANFAEAVVANREEPDEVVPGVTLTPAAKPAATFEQMPILMDMFLSKIRRRSITGLASETGLPKEQVKTLLDELVDQGLVAQEDTDKGVRWVITQDGRDLAGAAVPRLKPIAAKPSTFR